MTKKQSRRQGQANQNAGEMDENVDKIRDILFGGQMRDYEKRFDDLEKRLSTLIERLSTGFDKKIERLNNYARREVDRLSEQLKTERKDRIADDKQATRDIKDLTQQMESWFGEVEEQYQAEAKELRDSLDVQSEDLATAIRETRDELHESMIAESRELADANVAREDLAGLLSEVALRLQKDVKLPKG